MSLYSVIREAGPGFLDGGFAAQPDVADHTAFMNALAEEGLLLFAGPLAGTETGRLRALLIMSAAGEDEIRRRHHDDPWVRTDRLVITSIEPWNVMSGRSGSRRPAPEPDLRQGEGSSPSLPAPRNPQRPVAWNAQAVGPALGRRSCS